MSDRKYLILVLSFSRCKAYKDCPFVNACSNAGEGAVEAVYAGIARNSPAKDAGQLIAPACILNAFDKE